MAKNLDKANKEAEQNVKAFLDKVANTPAPAKSGGAGRLIFALDATASRQPTWDQASHLQREMFNTAAEVGKLELQIAFFRGFGEFKATRWTQDSRSLTRPLSKVSCLGGHTQFEKVLKHTLKQTTEKPVNALVYVGDSIEEDVDHLCHLAGQIGMKGVPVFIFQEGYDPIAEACFKQICRLTNGAFCRFDAGSAAYLRSLLKAVAIFAAGGKKALRDYSKNAGGEILLLSNQIK
ncbi:VWA domain-containing protein [Sneathiella sp.]|jgi:hypothetical protein|uniref:VWA domain-containing protein n=1 Tax=Sneathiella sp. TaxID=1964365 RepID=UPI0039E4F2BE